MNANSDWITKTLGAVIRDIGDGGTPDTNKKEYFGGSIPWVVIQDIRKETFTTRTTLTQLGLASCSAKLWPAGSILLSTGATIGEVGIAMVPVATKQGIHGIVCGDELSSSFLYYKLQTLRPFLNASAQGSTIREVRAPFLCTIPISFPSSLPEQDKIAEILSMVDRLIEKTEASIAKQQRSKTGLMQDLLTRGIDEHGNIRSEQTHEFKESPLGRIPVEWEVKKLSDATSKLITYGIVQPGPHLPDGVPFIQTKNLKDGELDIRSLDRTSLEIHGAYERSAVRVGDIVIGIRASVGLVAKVPLSLDGANISRGIARLSPSEDVSGSYLFWIVQSHRIQDSIRMEIKGSTYPEITLPALRSILIPVPTPDEQGQITNYLDMAADQIGKTEACRDKLHSLKTGLMQDLLTGKKRVTPLLVSSPAL